MKNEWQPIETAPKDGTRIFVYDLYDNLFRVCIWDENYDYYMYGDGVGYFCVNPTHWMPLPAPPKGDN